MQPENRNLPIVLGIDLGTTNSLAAFRQDGKTVFIKNDDGGRIFPSVLYRNRDQWIVGHAAKDRRGSHPKSTVFSVKRLLGKSVSDILSIKNSVPFDIHESKSHSLVVGVDGLEFTPIELSSIILKEIKKKAEAQVDRPLDKAVITVPAYFSDAERSATRAAGSLAGFDVLRVFNEPTAAALAFGWDNKKIGTIAVFDLGGGTFDISVLSFHDGVIEVLSTNGKTDFGGDDIDRALLFALQEHIRSFFGISIDEDSDLKAKAIVAAEKLKMGFNQESDHNFEILFNGKGFCHSVSVDFFTSIVSPLFKPVFESCIQALSDAGVTLSDLNDVLLVGGQTRLPLIRNLVGDFFKRTPNTFLHPDEAVAEGAALQAAILGGSASEFVLLDVVPLSLGLETYGGLTTILIGRNAKVPISITEIFTTFVDNQTGIDLHVTQGERERALDNRSLARFKLSGIAPQPAGFARIEVKFLVNADGILHVSARNLATGETQTVDVKPTYGLTDEKLIEMLDAKNKFETQDVAFKTLAEARLRAEPILRAAQKNITEAKILLTREEAQSIEKNIAQLKIAFEENSPENILSASLALDKSTVRLAELLVKKAIQKVEDTQRA